MEATREQVDGWHILASPYLAYRDGRSVVVGKTLEVTGAIIPCAHGLHASEDIVSAWRSFVEAHGAPRGLVLLDRVTLAGDLQWGYGGKWVGRRRTVHDRRVVRHVDLRTLSLRLGEFRQRWLTELRFAAADAYAVDPTDTGHTALNDALIDRVQHDERGYERVWYEALPLPGPRF